jgi:hypothetical protein
MSNYNTIALNSNIIKKLQVKETALVLFATIALQFLIHLIPSYNNTPVGAILLPMFFAPFVAVIFFRLHVALLAGILGPVFNYLITGSPAPEIVSLLTIELMVFVFASSFILRFDKINIAAAPISIILAKLSSWLIALAFPVIGNFTTGFFIQSFISAIPGIFILFILNIFLIRLKDKA